MDDAIGRFIAFATSEAERTLPVQTVFVSTSISWTVLFPMSLQALVGHPWAYRARGQLGVKNMRENNYGGERDSVS